MESHLFVVGQVKQNKAGSLDLTPNKSLEPTAPAFGFSVPYAGSLSLGREVAASVRSIYEIHT